MDTPPESSISNSLTFDEEWLLINAVRQAFGIWKKSPITYAEAVELARDLAPKLIGGDSLLVKAFEADLIRLYRERAEARSRLENKIVKPTEVLNAEIDELETEAQQAEPGQNQTIESEIRRLRRAKSRLEETIWTETQAINRDADIPERELPISHKGQGYKEYPVSKDRRLRVRVLHPDPPEARSGVDLIYESYYDQKGDEGKIVPLVRIAALQYKMWDGKKLYTSQAPSLLPQLEKMRQTFCAAGFCENPDTLDGDERYRLPHCCAFLRPTDRKQTRDAWQVTHAWQVPVCVAFKKFQPTDDGNKVIRSSQISNSATTQDTFQELYNRGMLGSRWMNVSRLQKLYAEIGVFDNLDRIVIHAQEY